MEIITCELPAFACLRVRAEGDYAAALRAGLDGLGRCRSAAVRRRGDRRIYSSHSKD